MAQITYADKATGDTFAATEATLIKTVVNANDTSTAAHIANAANPHGVTKSQVGLGNVDNTADTAKPVSTAQAAAIATKEPLLVSVAVQTSSAFTTANANIFVPTDTTSNSIVITLPPANDNDTYGCKMVVLGASNTTTLQCSGTQKFNTATGPTTLVLTLLNQGVYLKYLGGIWYVLSETKFTASSSGLTSFNGRTTPAAVFTLADLPALTGYAASPGVVSATDTPLTAIQKLDGNLNTSAIVNGSELTTLNGQLVPTGYASGDILRDVSRSIIIDNGNMSFLSPFASINSPSFKMTTGGNIFAKALSLTGSILWVGEGFNFVQLSSFFPQTGGQGEVGDNTRRYGSGYINTFITNIVASSGGLVLGAQESGGVAVTTVSAGGATSQLTLRSSDNTGAGASGSVLIFAGIASGGGVSGNVAINTASVPAYQGMVRGMFVGNCTTAPTGNPVGGGYLYVEAGALKYRGTAGTVTVIGVA